VPEVSPFLAAERRHHIAWGVSPRNMGPCIFSKPQRGGTELCAPRPAPFDVTPLGFRTERARRVLPAPASWEPRQAHAPGFTIAPLHG
jgi:hypothetical protein